MNNENLLKIFLLLVTAIVVMSFFVACGDDDDDNDDNDDYEASGYTDLSAVEAKELIDGNEDLIIIDVSPDYDEGHLPGALSYPLGDGSFDDVLPDLDPAETYLIYCHADDPAITAAVKLVDEGFEMVYRLEGNYQAWVDAGYDIES